MISLIFLVFSLIFLVYCIVMSILCYKDIQVRRENNKLIKEHTLMTERLAIAIEERTKSQEAQVLAQ